MARAILGAAATLGIGLGVFSCAFFIWIGFGGLPHTAFIGIVLLSSLALTAVLLRGSLRQPAAEEDSRLSPYWGLLMAVFLAYAAWLLARYAAMIPHGHWDAWGIWNLHARFLFRGGADWNAMSSWHIGWTHADYPLLLPGIVAAGWRLAGGETTLVPALVSLFFSVAVIGLMFGAVALLTTTRRACFAVLVLLATPRFLLLGPGHEADIPLSFYFLLTIALIHGSDRLRSPVLLALAGMAAGLAAWTKNEGLLFLVVLVAARVLVQWIANGRPLWTDLRAVAAGSAPVLAVVLTYKYGFAPDNDLFTQNSMLLERATDLSRYAQVASGFANELKTFGDGPVPALLGLAALALFVRAGRDPAMRRKPNPVVWWAAAVPVLMACGYFAVYIITPQNIAWHIASSLPRLMLHLWPLAIFAVATAGAAETPRSAAWPAIPAAPRLAWAKPAGAFFAIVAAAAAIGIPGRGDVRSEEAAAEYAAVLPIAAQPSGNPVEVVDIQANDGLLTGHARIDATDGHAAPAGLSIIGNRLNQALMGHTVAPAAAPVRAAVVPFRITADFVTALAISNTTDTPARLTLSANASGNAESRSLDLPPWGRVLGFLDDPPFDMSAAAGALQIDASVPVAVSAFLAHRRQGGNFSIAPVPAAHDAMAAATHLLYAPMQEDWPVEVTLVNPTGQTLRGVQRLYDAQGIPIVEIPYAIAPRGSLVQMLPETGNALRLAIVPADGAAAPASAAIRMHSDGSIMHLVGAPAVPAQFDSSLYVEWSHAVHTTIAIANTAERETLVRMTLAGMAHAVRIAPGATGIVEINDFPAFFAQPLPIHAMVKIEADAPVAAVAMRHIVSGLSRRLTALYGAADSNGAFFPHFAAGGGFTNRFVFSSADADASGLLRFTTSSGAPFELLLKKHSPSQP